MHRHSVKIFCFSKLFILTLVLSILMPTVLVAQNTRLNGIWVAPVTKGTGPGFLAYTFHVEGNAFTGAMSDKGGPAESFTDGKIDNGHISFSFPVVPGGSLPREEGRSFTGTFKDDRHLDLVEDVRFTGYKLIRKPGNQSPPNTLEGEWVFNGPPNLPHFVFHVQGMKLTGEVLDHDIHDGIVGPPVTLTMTDGTLRGQEISFQYVNRRGAPMIWRGTLAADHLLMDSEVKNSLRAVQIVDASGTFLPGARAAKPESGTGSSASPPGAK